MQIEPKTLILHIKCALYLQSNGVTSNVQMEAVDFPADILLHGCHTARDSNTLGNTQKNRYTYQCLLTLRHFFSST